MAIAGKYRRKLNYIAMKYTVYFQLIALVILSDDLWLVHFQFCNNLDIIGNIVAHTEFVKT